MATTNGKGTTPISTFLALGKEVKRAEQGVVLAWLSVYETFVRDGWADKQAFARAFVRAQNSKTDVWTENTVRQNVSLVEWAQENIKGGARACASMKHIVESRSGGKAKVVEPVRPAGVITISAGDARARLRKSPNIPNVLVDEIVKALGLR